MTAANYKNYKKTHTHMKENYKVNKIVEKKYEK